MTTWTPRKVKGHTLTDQYFINDYAPKTLFLDVSDTGDLRDPEYGFDLIAERWGDGEYITNGVWVFLPAPGELDRIGCKIKLCGSAA